MAKIKLLIDTDVFIDYLNNSFPRTIFENSSFEIYYSVITKKELLSKQGLKDSERKPIIITLKQFRLIPLDNNIAKTYTELRNTYSSLEKEDALIAATAMQRKLPVVTRNWKHYKNIEGLVLFKLNQE